MRNVVQPNELFNWILPLPQVAVGRDLVYKLMDPSTRTGPELQGLQCRVERKVRRFRIWELYPILLSCDLILTLN